MKSTNQNSEKNVFNRTCLLLVLATTIGFAQTEKQTQENDAKAKSNLSTTGAQNNPYFKDNTSQGTMLSVSGESKEPVQVLKTRTKSNQTNERTTKPNGQDDGNPFPPKSQSSNGKPQIATYDLKANKKV
ncbi:hypothetical protein ACNQGB_19135 [Flavobacterium sp. XS1P32]|jgi:hypothetical protein|uniref:hypothetical protein n=1 Tax=unclassified Flavobacterium TaxID=196869 RepID=UPI003AB0D0B5